MCCHIRSASVSRRRQIKLRKAPTVPPLAMLDLSKPGELQAHDFLLRTTDPKDKMWRILDVRRHGDVLLCVVRWTHPHDASKPFALAEVSLTEAAVHWQNHSSAATAQAEMERRAETCATSAATA